MAFSRVASLPRVSARMKPTAIHSPARPCPSYSCHSDGMCECTGGWTGGDCSVLLNATCLAGSRRAVPRPDDHGTCWQECKCDAEGQQCRQAVAAGGGRCSPWRAF